MFPKGQSIATSLSFQANPPSADGLYTSSHLYVNSASSDNTKKNFKNMCEYYKVPVYFFSNKDDLGHAIGKEFRASLAILDEGFKNSIEKHFKQDQR